VLEQLTGTAEAVPYAPPAGLIGHIREMSSVFEHALNRLAAEHDIIASARGVGVMRALELTGDAALKAGLLVNRTAERVVRLLPPLNVTKAEIDEAASILDAVLSTVRAEVTT
jgi:acetylornithine/succinyldiaminopimelate/putrescine aminotransferase